MLSRDFFSSLHAARAVQEVCGAHQVVDVADGKASYWAQTFFVHTDAGKYFVKQTTNPEKAEMSLGEPGATQLASEHGIPCPLALRVFNAGHFEENSLPTVVYESVTSSNPVVDGSDIAPEAMSQDVLNQVATMLARINGVPVAASKNGFLRGSDVDYRKQLRTLIEQTTLFDNPQKDAIASRLSTINEVKLFFTTTISILQTFFWKYLGNALSCLVLWIGSARALLLSAVTCLVYLPLRLNII